MAIWSSWLLVFGVIVLTGCAQNQADQQAQQAQAAEPTSAQQQSSQPADVPTPAPAPVTMAPAGISKDIVYTNSTYGFTITLPQTWKGYVTKSRTLDWGTPGTSDSLDFGFAAQDSLFNISIHTKAQWQAIKAGEGPTPTYLGENAKYIFGYATAQFAANDAMIARMKETQGILKTFKTS